MIIRDSYIQRIMTASAGFFVLVFILSLRAPADPKLKQKASNAWVDLFVICRCMSRLHRQIPASFDHYLENETE